jgi:transposase InsO family protein
MSTAGLYDQGNKFNGFEFQDLLANAGIKNQHISAKNPQSNGVIERIDQTVAQVIGTMILIRPSLNNDDANLLLDEALATAMHATRCVSHSSLSNLSPGALTFHRDMFLDNPPHCRSSVAPIKPTTAH